MRHELLAHLACPSCGGDLALTVDAEEDGEILTGTLQCAGCSSHYEIARGVPRINVAMTGLGRVAKSFDYEWKAHHRGELEQDTVFGRSREDDWQHFVDGTGWDEERIKGALILDAGCGPGTWTRQMAERGAGMVIGMDIIDAVDDAYAYCRSNPKVHIIQGNVFSPPLKQRQFDLVWSNGVIHHTPDAKGAHLSLSHFVKPGGTFFVWVYAARFNPFRFTKTVLDALQVTRLPEPALLRISKAFAYTSLGVLRGYQLLRKLPGLRPHTAWGHRKVRDRTIKELELTWFDTLSPEYDTRHSEAEVIGWFTSLGFTDIRAMEEPKVGVSGMLPAESAASPATG